MPGSDAVELERTEVPVSDAGYEERLKATGRNDNCPCGSGRKYKKCHLAEDERARGHQTSSERM